MRFLLLLSLLAIPALAQDVPAPPSAPTTGDPSTDAIAQLVLRAVSTGNGWLIAGAAVAALVWVLRNKLKHLLPATVQAALDNPVVAFLVPILVAVAGGFVTAFVAGPITGPVVVSVLLDAVKVSAASALAFLGGANVKEALTKRNDAATDAGDAAAAKVVDLPSAAAELRQQPPEP